ncbi:MAG: hypothetical protein ACK4WJ_01660 [Endomicrobiia bacterium]
MKNFYKITKYILIFLYFIFGFKIQILSQEPDKNEVFTQLPIWGGQVDGASLCYSSPSVIYAWNALNLWVSKDAAESWQKTKLNESAGSGPSYVAVHPSSPNIVLAWVEALEMYDVQRGLYRSEDYGETWIKIPEIENFLPAGHIQLNPKHIHFSLKDFDTVYLFGNPYYPPEGGGSPVVLYKSTDVGKTWEKKILFGGDTIYSPTISINVTRKDNDEIIYIGTTYKKEYGWEYKLFKSTDGGVSWQDISIRSGDFYVEPIEIKTSTTGCVAIYGGGEDKLYISTDTGNSFSHFKIGDHSYANKYYFNEEIPAFAFSVDGGKIYLSAKGYDVNIGSTVARIIVSSFTGSAWSQPVAISTGLLAGIAPLEAKTILIDQINPNNMYIADNFDYAFFKSTDGGYVWEAKNFGLAGAYVNNGVKDSLGNLYIVTKSAVYKSSDTGNTWNKIYCGPTSLEGFKIAVHPQNNNLIFLLGFGSLYLSDDGGNKWKDTSNKEINLIPYSNYGTGHFSGTTNAVFDVRNSSMVYYGRYAFGFTLIKSKNIYTYNIATKENKPLDFESYYVFSLVSDPEDPSILYAGVGEFTTDMKGELWKIKIDENGNVVSTSKLGLEGVIPFKIIFDTSNPNIIYAACYNQEARVGPNFKWLKAYGGLYMSENRGNSWKQIGVLGDVKNSVGINSVIDFQLSGGVLYVANKDETGFTNLYYSLNNGLTFEKYQANIGEIKCLILGSLYAGSSSGLWRLDRPPQKLTSTIEKPKVYSFPNPFNPKNGYTVLKYFVPQGQKVDSLRVSIYNIAGELIYEFSDRNNLDGGYAYYYAWDGKNQNGNLCSKGVYIVVFRSNLGVTKTKVVLVK